MAAEPTTNNAPTADFSKHAKDYSRLISMLKWGAIIAFLIGMLVLVVISN